MRLKTTTWESWDYWGVMTHRETPGDSWYSERLLEHLWGLMRLKETTSNSWDSKRLMGTHEIQIDLMETYETNEDSWDSETTGDSCDSERLLEHLWGLMRLKETTSNSWDSKRLMGTHEIQIDLMETYETNEDSWDSETTGDSCDSERLLEHLWGLMRLKRLLETHDTQRDSWGLLILRETNGGS